MDALAVLRGADVPLALVHDEYGHLDGIVTPGSILARAGRSLRPRHRRGRGSAVVERDDGSWLVSGAANADLLSDRLGVNLPHDRDYSTVAGFALSVLKHLPETGEKFRHDGWTFEIVDLDGRKIDKLIAIVRRAKAKAKAEGLSKPRHLSFRACRTSARTRRYRPARDNRLARRRGRGRGGRGMRRAAADRASTWPGQAGDLSKRVMPSAWSASPNLGPTPFSCLGRRRAFPIRRAWRGPAPSGCHR